MLWAALDLDILEDPAFVELEDEVPGAFWLWVRVLQQAKRVNQGGLVLRADGRPLTARDLYRIHRTASLETWEGLLDRCVELELLSLRDGIYRVMDWRRWHRSPSDMPDQVAARVAQHRARQRAQQACNGAPEPPVTPCNESNDPVTTCNECNDTEQSRAEQVQSKTEQKQNTPHTQQPPAHARAREEGTSGPLQAGMARALTHGAADPAAVMARLREFNEQSARGP